MAHLLPPQIQPGVEQREENGVAGFLQLGDEIGPSSFLMSLLSIDCLQKRCHFFSLVDVQQA